MKKSKKLLIALLSATCLTAGAFGFAACGETNDDAMYKIYNEYVATVPEGQTAKTYEDWLKETLTAAAEKGDQGDKGDRGTPGEDGLSAYDLYKKSLPSTEAPKSLEDWLASLYGAQGTPGNSGEDGISITGVKLSTDGKKLVFSFSKGADVELTLPAHITHEHTYDDNAPLNVVLEPTVFNVGLGYKECTDADCDHLELVVIPLYSYMVTVTDYDGNPLEGATVTIDEAEVETDENGVAIFDDLEKGAYDISVALEGYGALTTSQTSAAKPDYEVKLAKTITENTITEAGTYIVNIGWERIRDEVGVSYSPYIITFNLAAEKERNTHFKVTYDGYLEGGWRCEDEYSLVPLEDEVFEADCAAGANVPIYLTFDDSVYSHDDYADTTFAYTIKVEYSKGPETGTVASLPVSLKFGENTLSKFDANGAAYVEITNDIKQPTYSNIAFEYGSDAEVYIYGTGDNGKKAMQSAFSDATLCVPGSPVAGSSYYKSYVKIVSKNGAAVTFTVNPYYVPGTENNPFTGTFGTASNTDSGRMQTWYKYDCTEEGLYYVELVNCSGLSVYGEDKETELTYLESEEAKVIKLEKDKSYYFAAYREDENLLNFLVRKYSEATDAGINYIAPKALTLIDNQCAVTNARSTMYFETAVPAGYGRLSIKVTDADGNVLKYSNKGKQYDAATVTQFKYEGTANSAGLYELEEAGKVIFRVVINSLYSSFDGSYTLNVEFVPIVAADHTFTVKSGETEIPDVKVIVKDNDEVVAQGTTAADGTVTLNFVPGVYQIELEGLDADTYDYYTKVSTTFPNDGSKDNGSDYEIIVNAKTDYTATAKEGATLVEGLKLQLKLGTEVVATATTDENGNATFSSVFPKKEYKIEVVEYDAESYKFTVAAIQNQTCVITRISKVDYTVTAKEGEETLAGVTVNLVLNSQIIETKTTDENGVATFHQFPESKYTVTVTEYNEADYKFVASAIASNACTVTRTTKVAYTFTVKDADGTALNGVEVTVTDIDGNVAKGTTGEDGKVTMTDKVLPGENKVTCKGEAIPEGFAAKGKTESGKLDYELTAVEFTDTLSGTYDIPFTEEQTATAEGTYLLTFDKAGTFFIWINGAIEQTNSGKQINSATITLNVGDKLTITKMSGNTTSVTIELQ